MSNCSICNKKISKIFDLNCRDGYVCKDCCKELPSFLLDYVDKLSFIHIKNYIQWKNENYKSFSEQFVSSTEYGNIYLDSIHGILAIGDKSCFEDDFITSDSVVLIPVTYLSSFVINMGKVSLVHNDVSSQIRVSISVTNPKIDFFNIVIKEKDECFVNRTNDGNLEYSLPYGAQIFWDEVIETNHRLVDKSSDVRSFNSSEINELERAKGLFMITDSYSIEELKKQRNKLMKVFHPDADNSDDAMKHTIYIQKAYELLEQNLK